MPNEKKQNIIDAITSFIIDNDIKRFKKKLLLEDASLNDFTSIALYRNDASIQSILYCLNIKEDTRQDALINELLVIKYPGVNEENGEAQYLSLYELLCLLAKDKGHLCLTPLIKAIPRKTLPSYSSKILYFLIAAAGIGAGVFYHFKPALFLRIVQPVSQAITRIFQWTTKSLSVLKNLTFLAGALELFTFIYYSGKTLLHPTKTKTDKTIGLSLKAVHTALTIAAYTLTYFTAGVLSPVAAILLASAKATDIIKSAVALIKSHHRKNQWGGADEAVGFFEKIARLKVQCHFEHHKNTFFLTLVSSVVTAGIIIAWCLLPASLPITLSAIAALALTAFSSHVFKHHLKNQSQEGLKKAMHDIPSEENDLAAAGATSNTHLVQLLQQKDNVITEQKETINALRTQLKNTGTGNAVIGDKDDAHDDGRNPFAQTSPSSSSSSFFASGTNSIITTSQHGSSYSFL